MDKNPSQNLSSYLLDIKAVKLNVENPYTWASGMRSPIYCDNRITLSHPKIRNFIKDGFVKCAESFGEFDIIAGVATAGIPHGMLLADAMQKPFIYVRSKSKEHGRQNLIEGEITPGAKVLVVEDLISTGKSSIAAIKALQDIDNVVVGAVAIFTYGFETARKNFEDINIPLKTLTDYNILLEEASNINYITQDQKALLSSWKDDPKKWYEQNYN